MLYSHLWTSLFFILLHPAIAAAANFLPRDEPGPLSRLDKGERIAVGVGITIGVILIVIASIWCCCWPCRPTPRSRSPDRFRRHETAEGGVGDPEQADVDGSWVVQHREGGGRDELDGTSEESSRVQDGREAPPPYDSGTVAKDAEQK